MKKRIYYDQSEVTKYYSPSEHIPKDTFEWYEKMNKQYGADKGHRKLYEVAACGFALDGFEIDLYPKADTNPDMRPHIRIFMWDKDVTALYIIPPEVGKNRVREFVLAGRVQMEMYGERGQVVNNTVFPRSLLRTMYEADEYPHINRLLAARYGTPTYAQLDGDSGRSTVTEQDGTVKFYRHFIDSDYFFVKEVEACLGEPLSVFDSVEVIAQRLLHVDEAHRVSPLVKRGKRRLDFEPEYSGIIWAD